LAAGIDQPRQPARPGGVLLGPGQPALHAVPPMRRAGVIEGLRDRGRGERGQRLGRQRRRGRLLERVDRAAVLAAQGERGPAGGLHPAFRLELGHAGDVHRAPDRGRAAAGEADAVMLVVDALTHRVDPAHAQRLVHGLGPAEAGAAGVALDEAHVHLAGGVGMGLQPVAERGGAGKEDRGRQVGAHGRRVGRS